MKRIRLRLFAALLLAVTAATALTVWYTVHMRQSTNPVTRAPDFWVDPVSGNQYFVGVSNPDKTSGTSREHSFWIDPRSGNQYFVTIAEPNVDKK